MIRITQIFAILSVACGLFGCMAEPSDTNSSVATSAAQSSSSTQSSAASSVAPAGDIALGRAYFMQSTTQGDTAQLPDQQTPLAAGKSALLRAFITGSGNAFAYRADVQFHYQLQNGETGSVPLSGPILLPRSINEVYLSETYNAAIPAEIVQPGTRYYLSAQDANSTPEANTINNRYPAEGWADLPVLNVPPLDLVIVPVVTKSINPNLTDSRLQELLALTYQLYPFPDINVEIKPAITYTGESWPEMLKLVENIQIANGETDRYYLGIAGHPLTFETMNITAGYAYIGRRVATSLPLADTIAHELGHNFGREHAPCGDAPGADAQYPYANGEIGVYGLGPDGLRFNDSYYDVMSYCTPVWISDYTYDAVINKVAAASSENVLNSKTNSDVYVGSLGLTKSTTPNNPEPLLVINGELNSAAATTASIDLMLPSKRYSSTQPTISDYMAVIIDSNGNIAARQAFTPYQEDHGDGLHFTVAITKTTEARVLQIRYRDTVLTERTLDHSQTQVQKPAAMTAVRTDEDWVTLTNIAQIPAIIRDENGDALTIARASNIKVFTRSNQLTVNGKPVAISAP